VTSRNRQSPELSVARPCYEPILNERLSKPLTQAGRQGVYAGMLEVRIQAVMVQFTARMSVTERRSHPGASGAAHGTRKESAGRAASPVATE